MYRIYKCGRGFEWHDVKVLFGYYGLNKI